MGGRRKLKQGGLFDILAPALHKAMLLPAFVIARLALPRHVLLQVLEVVLDPVQMVRDEVPSLAAGAHNDDGALGVRVPADAVRVPLVADVAAKLNLEPVRFGLRLLLRRLGRLEHDGRGVPYPQA